MAQCRQRFVTIFAIVLVASAMPVCASDALQLSGFALLRGSSHNDGPPLGDDGGNAQLQLGIDWRPSMSLGAHVHLLGRDDAEGSRQGRGGVVEADGGGKLPSGKG